MLVMGKLCKVVICGQGATGKTAILEQLIYGNHAVGTVHIKDEGMKYIFFLNFLGLLLSLILFT